MAEGATNQVCDSRSQSRSRSISFLTHSGVVCCIVSKQDPFLALCRRCVGVVSALIIYGEDPGDGIDFEDCGAIPTEAQTHLLAIVPDSPINIESTTEMQGKAVLGTDIANRL